MYHPPASDSEVISRCYHTQLDSSVPHPTSISGDRVFGAQAVLKATILLPQPPPPSGWDDQYALLCLVQKLHLNQGATSLIPRWRGGKEWTEIGREGVGDRNKRGCVSPETPEPAAVTLRTEGSNSSDEKQRLGLVGINLFN